MELATVLTVRYSSERLPGKALAVVDGQPVLFHLIERLRELPGKIIVATSSDPSDDAIESAMQDTGISLFRGSLSNVLERVNGAVDAFAPNADYVFRALGDCPFIEIDNIKRSLDVMDHYGSDAFLWHLAPDTWPVYGAREFPFRRSAWKKIVDNATGTQVEHTDQYFHDNRTRFNVVYHEPPASVYFRNYRLEIDWQEDLELVQTIAKEIGLLRPLRDVIRFLDTRPEIASINASRIEKTGPLSTYDYAMRRKWMRAMEGKPVVAWDDTLWQIPEKAAPIFCNSGKDALGYAVNGVLYTKNGYMIAGKAYIPCLCGSGRYWK